MQRLLIKSLSYVASYGILKFIYSEKAKKFCEISTVDLTGTTYDKSMVEISQNLVAFSEYMNFNVKNFRVFDTKSNLSIFEWKQQIYQFLTEIAIC